MKTHVTLVNPPSPIGAPSSLFIPLGIGYLAAVLEKNQYEVNVIDCQALRPTRNQLKAELIKSHPDVVGVTSATLTYKPALEIVKTAKEALPNCLQILGGPHVTVLDEQTLNEAPEADIIVRGEGEQTMLELADLVSRSDLKNIQEVEGITFRRNDKIVRNKDRAFIQNLDELPHPAYEHFQLSKYKLSGKMYLPIITSRGCPFQCTFCLASRMCGKRFRTRSPKKVVDELEWLRDVHGADVFAFYDDTFTFDIKRAYEICEEMKNRGFDLPWDCRTRVDRISTEVLSKMRDANCQLIHFGVESGSQKMLSAMKKGTTVEQNERAIRWTKEVGISVAISVVVGYPGETADMLKQTFDFIRKTGPDYVYVCQAIPYPGTELYDLLKELGWDVSTEWNRYDEQSQVFKNPILSPQKIDEMRGNFYNSFFSPTYFLRKSLKRDFYSQIMTRAALNHLLWRIKLPRWVSSNFRRLAPQKRSQWETQDTQQIKRHHE
ncbi:B12-binding domain-containing radical SAM protein [Candidatus Bathyarchaeota archaeon]|nr:B12-binding domain-containing radical SAM protein [Candidatus Bathyarchaeota archaeon]